MRWMLCLCLLGLVFGCKPKAEAPNGKIQNAGRGFAITFPPEWEVRENQLGLDVIGLSPLEGPSDKFQDNVTVASADMPKPLDAEAILDGNIPAMINLITDFQPAGRGRTKVGPREAAWMCYTQRQGIFRLTVTLYAVAGKKYGYLIHCTSETSAADRFKPKCEGVVNSFRTSP